MIFDDEEDEDDNFSGFGPRVISSSQSDHNLINNASGGNIINTRRLNQMPRNRQHESDHSDDYFLEEDDDLSLSMTECQEEAWDML